MHEYLFISHRDELNDIAMSTTFLPRQRKELFPSIILFIVRQSISQCERSANTSSSTQRLSNLSTWFYQLQRHCSANLHVPVSQYCMFFI